MTVKNLKDKLATFPDDAVVLYASQDGVHDYYCEAGEPELKSFCRMKNHPHWQGLYVDEEMVRAAGNASKVETDSPVMGVLL